MVYSYIEGAISSLENVEFLPTKLERKKSQGSISNQNEIKRTLTLSKPRLATARNAGLDTFEAVIEAYLEWRDFNEYVVVRKKGTDQFLAVLARKRGNKKYNKKLKRKLNLLTRSLAPKRKLGSIFVVLTHEHGRYHKDPIHDQYLAWHKLGERFNRYISWLKKKFPDLTFYRVWESSESGYPHVHIILFSRYFLGKKKPINKEKSDTVWGAWTWLNKIYSPWGAMNYLKKYLVKTYEHDSHQLTAAMLWYHRKRSFSISKSLFLYLIQEKRYSNPTTLDGEKIEEEWVFLGIMTYEEIKSNILVGDIRFV